MTRLDSRRKFYFVFYNCAKLIYFGVPWIDVRSVTPGHTDNPVPVVVHAGEARGVGAEARSACEASDAVDDPAAANGAQEAARVAEAGAVATIHGAQDGAAGWDAGRVAIAFRHANLGLSWQVGLFSHQSSPTNTDAVLLILLNADYNLMDRKLKSF